MAESSSTSSTRRRRRAAADTGEPTIPNVESGASSSAPKDTPRTAPKDDGPKRRTPSERKLAASLAGTYQGVGMMVVGIGFRTAGEDSGPDMGLVGMGTAFVNNAEPIAEAWLELADKNPSVKKALQRFTEASAAGTLIAIHLACVIPLLIDRKVVPEQVAAFVPGMGAEFVPNGNGPVN